MKVYVLVEVMYDYYRFQENLAANTKPCFCSEDYKKSFMGDDKNYKVYNYKVGSDMESFLDKKEEYHFWIQEFEVE